MVVDLNQIRINTDSGIFPFQASDENTVGLESRVQLHTPTFETPGTYSGTVIISFQGTDYYTQYKRTFLKILDAFSYIGGIFNALLAAFFFMKLYGESFFEMNFAKRLFRKKEVKHYGFFGFIKQTLYKLLLNTSCHP